MLTVGCEGVYDWLVTDEQFDFLQLCPQVVLRKYVAVTSIDSGALIPTDRYKAIGWQSREKIGYSQRIQKIEEMPSAGWDEWYIFESPTDLGTSHLAENIFEVPHEQGHISVFVNYDFAPTERSSLTTLFWQQIARICPESYVWDNDYVTLVSANKALFASVLEALKALS